MFTANELLKSVNDYLDHITYNRRPASLYAPIQYVLSIGGKRIRPVLMLLAYNLYRDDAESILAPACALETYHNYTLLHDDLMDRAELRRGHETVHKRWDANTAILSGDSMLVLAYERMQQCDARHLKDVFSLFTETALEIGEGQQYDMDFERRTDVTEEEYVEMIRLKTSVLLACAVKMGALLADAPAADADRLYRFGEQFGLAFQLQDDYLDVYGDPKLFGKAIGGDILSNKKTYMLIQAFNRADSRQRAELERWTGMEHFDPQEKIAAITKLYDDIGVDRLAQAKIRHHFDESKKYLAQVEVADERKRHLIDYTNEMMQRQY
ncbi:MAG: polyprenyl synthetase family protein [Prevotella sp.]|nr:polyprenyl synthetase family protein [Prevotella sp.]MBQ2553884.1 polyprenyl synthetase family protein [Prevotella sp.]